ncbi:DNA polymerase zeta processivity subunit [Pseudocercospora fuligena]|uniref:DNA polymerase zeta processivity subunit n=1 Tax=Pseudocercospora fuligena TaxID=685502 RepID=A0A8H6VDS2_9PEZI|nr:DNA polymerase zeta processivity subunit [Pseudocercospora fuligena]
MPNERPTYRIFVTAFTDFLAVAIHTILYERKIYPETAFISAKKYNFPVRQNRHPKVCEWINDAINAVEIELFKGTVERVAVVIYSKQAKPLERVVFDVSRFPVVPSSQIDVPLERVEADGSQAVILPIVDLEEQLRATMSRLSNCGSSLRTLAPGCSFTVAIELRAQSEAPLKHPQPWVPAERQSNSQGEESEAQTRTVPVRSVAAGEMIFETWLEELEDQNSTASSQSTAGYSDSF